jgi:hypothetical protein
MTQLSGSSTKNNLFISISIILKAAFQPHGVRSVAILRKKCHDLVGLPTKNNFFIYFDHFKGGLPPWCTTFAEPYRRGPTKLNRRPIPRVAQGRHGRKAPPPPPVSAPPPSTSGPRSPSSPAS